MKKAFASFLASASFGCRNWSLVWPSGYEMCLKRLCNLVKSRVLADLSIRIGEMVFRTFVHFFELF